MAKACTWCACTNSYICGSEHCGLCAGHTGEEDRERGFPGNREEDYQ